MRRIRPIGAMLAFVVMAIATHTAAQQPRDGGYVATPAPPQGTATITGALTTDESDAKPLRRAILHLTAEDGSTRLGASDDDGHFTFSRLPAGAYALSASKTGFVTAYYGATRPGRGPGSPIALADGARVTVAMKVPRGGVITGQISDPRGQPVANLVVHAVPLREALPGPPVRVASPLSRDALSHILSTLEPTAAVTDDRGIYRIYGLTPGEYVVAAVPNVPASPDTVATTDDQARWVSGLSRETGAVQMPPPGQHVAYAPIFFPGTADLGAATTVTLGVGEERGDVGFLLPLVPTAVVAGTTIDAVGQPIAATQILLLPRRGVRASVWSAVRAAGFMTAPPVRLDGATFSFAGIAPGDYTLLARTGAGGRGRGPATGAVDAEPPVWASVDLTVAGMDQSGLVVRLLPGATITGTIVFDGANPPDGSRTSITLEPALPVPGYASPAATITPPSAFAFHNVRPGTYDLHAEPAIAGDAAGSGWVLKSAVVGGRDLAEDSLDLHASDSLPNVVLTFTNHGASIDGAVIDAGGKPVASYSVVVFPADRRVWRPGSRRIRTTHLATDGAFAVRNLLAGAYAIAVVDDLDPIDLDSPDFLTTLLAAAQIVTLADSEHKTQNLKIER